MIDHDLGQQILRELGSTNKQISLINKELDSINKGIGSINKELGSINKHLEVIDVRLDGVEERLDATETWQTDISETMQRYSEDVGKEFASIRADMVTNTDLKVALADLSSDLRGDALLVARNELAKHERRLHPAE